jgi:Xaa-Pro aminopeptidase
MLALLDSSHLQSVAFSHLPNIRYFSGFTGSNGVLLLTPTRAILFTDPRYELQAGQETDVTVKIIRGSLWPEVAKTVQRFRLKTLALEDELLSYAEYRRVSSLVGKQVRLHDASGLAEALRAVKDEGEIAAIRASMKLCGDAYLKTLKKIHTGMSETDVAAELEYRMRRMGADGPSFETIVAAGERSALPHARPTGAKIRTDQLLLIDMGASLGGYASDMTRVVHIGKASPKAKSLYNSVLEAQLAALDAVRPGAKCAEIDAAARKSLRRHGFDKFFQHSTGHGLGLEIHEGPRVGRKVADEIVENMVITIEPGAYLPGFGGVRIEDTVLVTAGGAEILTRVPKELMVLEA